MLTSPKVVWLGATIASALDTFGSTAGSLLNVCDAEVVTATVNARRRRITRLFQAAVTVRWKMGTHPIQPTTGAAVMQRRSCSAGRTNAWQTKDHQGESSSRSTKRPSGRSPLFYAASLTFASPHMPVFSKLECLISVFMFCVMPILYKVDQVL
jgi:hypothetical protein